MDEEDIPRDYGWRRSRREISCGAAFPSLTAYGYGLLFYAGLKVLQPAFYAIEKRWLPVIARLIGLFVNIGCNYVFVFVFKLSHESLALTTSIVASLNFVFLYFAIRRYAGDILALVKRKAGR